MTGDRGGAYGVRHLIGDVQRFGLLSAATVVERYIQAVDRAIASAPSPSPTGTPGEGGPGALVDSTARVAEVGIRALDTLTALLANAAAHVTETAPGGRLVLAATRPGSSSEVSLWVHNPTSTAAAGVDLHVTALASSTGRTLPIGAVSLAPARLELIEASSRHEVRVRVRVPADQAPGHYHGLVLSSAAPFEPLALQLEVLADGSSET